MKAWPDIFYSFIHDIFLHLSCIFVMFMWIVKVSPLNWFWMGKIKCMNSLFEVMYSIFYIDRCWQYYLWFVVQLEHSIISYVCFLFQCLLFLNYNFRNWNALIEKYEKIIWECVHKIKIVFRSLTNIFVPREEQKCSLQGTKLVSQLLLSI